MYPIAQIDLICVANMRTTIYKDKKLLQLQSELPVLQIMWREPCSLLQGAELG